MKYKGGKIMNNKGSQHLICKWVNENQADLNKKIISSSEALKDLIGVDGKIQWISPLKSENYLEHRDDFLVRLGVKDKVISKSFWPKNGPVWDGLAKAKDKDGNDVILLIEAKAHTDELNSTMKATSEKSIDVITNSLEKLRVKYNISNECKGCFENKYYQLANRLAYMDYLNSELGIKTFLVLINFADDSTHIKTSRDEWGKHYEEVYSEMGISDNAILDNVVVCIL